jgi:hypothetical protein
MTSVIIQPETEMDSIELDKISEMMSCMTVSSGLLFPGAIDMRKMEAALQALVGYCPWLCGRMSSKENGAVFVVPRADADYTRGYMRCEVDDRTSSDYDGNEVKVSDLLPKEIHEKMVRVDLAMLSVDEIPVCALRVTKFKEHFAITYRLNHAFYDQNSTVYLFTFLGQLYSQSDVTAAPTLPVPAFIPRAHITKDFSLPTDADAFEAAAPKGYMSAPMGALTFAPPISQKILLNSARIADFKKASSAAARLSTNDIVHAILAKALATREQKHDDENDSTLIRVMFARNMRTPLGLGRHVTGDYVRLETLSLSPQEVVGASLLQLAELNRAYVDSELGDVYIAECAWFLEFHKHHQGRANVDFLMDQSAGVVTNWSSFPYEDIRFGDSVTLELLLEDTPMMTHNGFFARISFHGVGSERRLFVVVDSMNQYMIDNLRSLETETGLFTCV